MLEAYVKTAREREALGIPPRPLDAEQVRAFCALLVAPPLGEGEFLLGLLRDCVSPGVDHGARVKAESLGAVARGELRPPLLSPSERLTAFKTRVASRGDELYRPLLFDLAEV